jgi:DNA repair protein RecO (recombination protein O)
MLKRTEGIVLKNGVFGEADLIVTYLTKDYGLMKAFAKSPRKIKSRFGSSLEPLTYARISFLGKEDANLPRLTQSDIIRPFHPLREDLKCILDISKLLDMSLKFLPDREPNPDVFKLLLSILIKLESGCGNRLYHLYYKIRLLENAGYLPKPDQKYDRHDSGMLRLSSGALNFYRSLLKWHVANIERIKAPENFISEIDGFIEAHSKWIMEHR